MLFFFKDDHLLNRNLLKITNKHFVNQEIHNNIYFNNTIKSI